MRYAWRALGTWVLRRPLAAGSLLALSGIGVGLALATPGIGWRGAAASAPGPELSPEEVSGPGEAARTEAPVPDFVLTDQAGRRVRLREQAGKVLLVNFVTTQCTTVCPQVTRELRGLQQALGSRMGREVQFLSVGVDPRRDTPTALRRFADRHGVDFTGWAFLSGTAEEMEAARRAFGALAMPAPQGQGHGGDDLEHTAVTYVVGPHGVVRKKIPPGFLTLIGLREVEAVLRSAS